MNVNINLTSINPEVIMLIIIGWSFLMVILIVLFQTAKENDQRKVSKRRFGTIIGKPDRHSSQVYWVIVDFEDGTRRRMRVFDKNIILCVGDEGIIEYQGQTIRKMIKDNDF